MKRSIWFALLILTSLLAAAAYADAKDDAVATVNGVAIPQADLLRMMVNVQLAAQQEGRRLSQEEVVSWRQKVLDQLIGNELLFQEAKKAKISVDPKVIEQFIAQARSRFPSDVEFKRALAKKQLSVEILKREIERDKVVESYLSGRFLKSANPGDAEIKKYYDTHADRWSEVRARHILVAYDAKTPSTKASARKKIDDILVRLKKGEDFAALARQYSDCPSKERGGDLGFFTRGTMVPEFSQAAFALSPRQLSSVVETKFGYHVIKVEEKRTTSLEEAKDAIRRQLQAEKMEGFAGRHVADLRKNAKVVIHLDEAAKASANK